MNAQSNPIALIYRPGKSCQQYHFYSIDEITKFVSRHPYKNEQLRVMPVRNMELLDDSVMPAADVVTYITDIQAKSN